MDSPPSSILIVDDEELNRDGLARRLQRHGYQTTPAENGVRALELLGDRPFDLVLLDVMMPEMNGLEVLKFLRRMDTLVDLPVIMVTARGESEDVVEALELGANDYVTKPLNFPVVLARVRTQLALRRTLAQVTELDRKLTARNRELEGAATELTAVNRRMTDDLGAAARIQEGLLPRGSVDAPKAHFAWCFRPATLPAGAFLDVIPVGAKHRGLCVVDAGAHGASGALLALAADQLLAGAALCGGRPAAPAEVLARVAGRFSRSVTGAASFTLLYGVLELETGDFRYASAGHSGPVHLPRGGTAERHGGAGHPVGVAGGYAEHTVRLGPGDRLVLHTDGVTAARNTDGAHFGGDRLCEVLERTARAPLDESIGAVAAAVGEWGRGAAPPDVVLLAAERTAP